MPGVRGPSSAAWAAAAVVAGLWTVSLLSGCFGGGQPRTTPIEDLEMTVEATPSVEGYASWRVASKTSSWILQVTPWADDVVRVEFTTADVPLAASGLTTYGFIDPPRAPPGLMARGDDDAMVLEGGDVRVRIEADASFTVNGHGPFRPSREDGGVHVRAPAAADERYFGLGEVFSGIEHRGKTISAHIRYGTWDTARLAANPFHLSTRGYGALLDTTYTTWYDFAADDNQTVHVWNADENLRLFVFDGPAFTEVLQDYANVTGKALMPPKWMFGYIQSKFGYLDRTQLEDVATKLRQGGYPADGLVLDFFWRQNSRMEWVEANWPLHEQMLDSLHDQGFKIVLHEDTEMMRFYPDAPAGYRYATERAESPGLQILDVSNPDALDWYWTDVHEPLVREPRANALFTGGVDGFWIDEIDWAPETGDQPFHNEMLPAEMHNLYPNLFIQGLAERYEEDLGTRSALILRSQWTGGQRYPHVWSGDTGTTFSAFENDIKAGVSMGLSGFPFWGDDLGGFWGKPSDDLHVRWAAQFGAFNPFMRVHGTGSTLNMQTQVSSREPWHYGANAQEIFRDYDELRYRNLPYIYSLAHEAAATGLPLMRALVLDFQDDPETYAIDTQYMFGPAFLVAPIHAESQGGASVLNRSVYLPSGTWYDYWTDETVTGPKWVDWTGPLERFPVYVRAGAIVPTGPDLKFVDEKPLDPLKIHVWPSAAGSFALTEDDGLSLEYKAGAVARRTLSVAPVDAGFDFSYSEPEGSFETPARTVVVVFHGVSDPHGVQATGGSTQSVVHDPGTGTLTVAMKAGAESFSLQARR